MLLLRLVVAVALLGAGGTHLGHLEAFARAVRSYRLLPGDGRCIAAVLAPLELLTGLALATGVLRRGGALVAGGLLLLFLLALLQAWVRGLDITCGCFGTWLEAGPLWAMARDAGLLLALGLAFVIEARRVSPVARPDQVRCAPCPAPGPAPAS